MVRLGSQPHIVTVFDSLSLSGHLVSSASFDSGIGRV